MNEILKNVKCDMIDLIDDIKTAAELDALINDMADKYMIDLLSDQHAALFDTFKRFIK